MNIKEMDGKITESDKGIMWIWREHLKELLGERLKMRGSKIFDDMGKTKRNEMEISREVMEEVIQRVKAGRKKRK